MSSMKKLFILFIFFSPLISLAGGTATGGGGGGGTLIIDDQRVLVDFFHVDENFRDSYSWDYKGVSFEASEWSSDFLMPINKKFQLKSSVDLLIYPAASLPAAYNSQTLAGQFVGMPAFQLAARLLQDWQRLSHPLTTATIDFILTALATQSWAVKESPDCSGQDQYKLPPSLSTNDSFKLVAYFQDIKKEVRSKDSPVTCNEVTPGSVNIYNDVWRELGVRSQAATLIHEALRQYQIGWSMRFQHHFNEFTLQQATAIISLCQPNTDLLESLAQILNSGTSRKELQKIKSSCQPL